ncbi:MAG: DUF1501 domain-containing protein [Planctomycetaceae bacterium]|nr:DUF1501 domain-containing protein [Planctomycetaceae bacterium]
MMFNRREWMAGTAGLVAGGLLGNGQFSLASEKQVDFPLGKAEHCLMIWLGGGAAQMDTFDPKRQTSDGRKDPGSAYRAIDTAVPGVQLCEHLPNMARLMERTTVLRTVHHDEIDEHAAASYRMHIGRPTSGTVVYPSLGSVITHEKPSLNDKVPAYVLMGYPSPGRQPGFLGPEYGFVYLTDTGSGPKGLSRPPRITELRANRRLELLKQIEQKFVASHGDETNAAAYVSATRKGFDLAGPEFMDVFDLEKEPADIRNAYGEEFGQRCLLARRLIERGSRFVEVSFNLTFVNGTGWDTHNEGQLKQHVLIQSLDQAFAALMKDLEQKKLLEKTLIVISTEFGRPATFDGGGGRGHHAKAFSVVTAGGGLQHRGAIGVTDDLAEHHAEGPQLSVPDLFATLYTAMGIDPYRIIYAGDRPVPLTDGGVPLKELFVS